MNTAKMLVSTSRRQEKENKVVKRRFKFTSKKKRANKKKQNPKSRIKTTIFKKSISIDEDTDSITKDFSDLYNKDLESVDTKKGKIISKYSFDQYNINF